MRLSFTTTFLLSLLVADSAAFAQTSVTKLAANSDIAPQTQTNVSNMIPEQMPAKTFGLNLSMEYSQKTAVDEKGARESSTDFTIEPSYQLNKTLNASVKAAVSKENSGARQTLPANTLVVLGIKGFDLTSELKTLHGITGVIPTNEESKKRDRLQGGVAITNGLQWTKTFVTVQYKLGLSKNFHEFTVNADGDPNIEYRLSNSLSVEIPLTDKFSIATVGVYRIGQTYNRFQRNVFEIHADLNYEIMKQLVINLGTSNEGNSLKSNGVDSNISAYNEDTSVTRLGLNLIF